MLLHSGLCSLIPLPLRLTLFRWVFCPREIYICLISPLFLLLLILSTQGRLPCLSYSCIPLCTEPPPASPKVCVPSSAALARLLLILLVSLRPSALPLLSCSLCNQHARDSLHAHSAWHLSRILHALLLWLFPLPSPPAHCLLSHMPCIAPCLLMINTWLLPLLMLSCHGLRALLFLRLHGALPSQI